MTQTYGWSGTVFSASTEIRGLEKFEKMNLAELAYEWAETYKPKLIDCAKAAAPVGQHYDLSGGAHPTYELQQSIQAAKSISGQRVRLELRSNSPHAKYVLKGTAPHQIASQGQWPLAFFWAKLEQATFRMWVDHPGTDPNPFMKEAAKQQEPAMRSSLVQFLNRRVHQ